MQVENMAGHLIRRLQQHSTQVYTAQTREAGFDITSAAYFTPPSGAEAVVGKLDVDENPSVTSKYSIRGIPAITSDLSSGMERDSALSFTIRWPQARPCWRTDRVKLS